MRAAHSVSCEGIGGERMRAAGFHLVRDTRGWSSMGPISALAKIPPLLAAGIVTAVRLRLRPPALIVLVDFGAFNVRVLVLLRWLGYRGPVLYYFPPAAWLDDERRARAIARRASVLTTFEHQRAFYRGLGLDVAYFGHPLVSRIAARPARPPADPRGGHVALLPGSRRGELRYHVPLLLQMVALLRARRPALRATFAAADADGEAQLRAAAAGRAEINVRRGAREVLIDADAAAIASGTAVLEAALLEVPAIALYVVSRLQGRIGMRLLRQRIFGRRYVTLPNLVLQREIVPEFLQDAATPQALAAAVERILDNPAPQLSGDRDVRDALGDAQTIRRCAAFALGLAGAST